MLNPLMCHRKVIPSNLGICLFLMMQMFSVSAALNVPDWPSLEFKAVTTNIFQKPTCITHARDGSGRIYVTEKGGRIYRFQTNNGPAELFLDLSKKVSSKEEEQGLLGLAFSPSFASNGQFYVFFNVIFGDIAIARLTVPSGGGVADLNSLEFIMSAAKPYANHNGGCLAFGPDGYLYIGMGDGGSFFDTGDPELKGQNPISVLGKLHRIDVESGVRPYSIPPSNPYVTNANFVPQIWAMGLRNPWRFSFDRLTGDLFIGDVGHSTNEEIDFQPANSAGGENYGWSILEGPTPYRVPAGFTEFSKFTAPIDWYDHASTAPSPYSAVVGGYVYRGPSEPRMNGVYFYGDFGSGQIWGLRRDGSNWLKGELVSVKPAKTPTNLQISTFGEDESGRLLLADYATGRIYYVQDSHRCVAPKFSFPGGTIMSNAVIVTSLTPGSAIHFTNSGADPTESDPVLQTGERIQVSEGTTNKLRSFRSDLEPSQVVSAIYQFETAAPYFIPSSGAITNNTPIQLFSTTSPDTQFFYTLDGSVPTTNSARYSNSIILSGFVSLTAIGIAPGYAPSKLTQSVYKQAQVAIPTLNPIPGVVSNGTSLSIDCATSGAEIFYSIDGSIPTTNSIRYIGPLTLHPNVLIRVIAVAPGYISSGVSGSYVLPTTATPVFAPAGGGVTIGTSVSITCSTPNSTIFFTTDGSVPNHSSQVYLGPLRIDGDLALSAVAVSEGRLDSVVARAFYPLLHVSDPVFTPASGPLVRGTLVTIQSETPGATVHYTTDGTDPGPNESVYTAPVFIGEATVLKSRAFRDDLGPSAISSTFYGLLDLKTNRVVMTLAGKLDPGFTNGAGMTAQFSGPLGICLDKSGNLLVADSGNNVIRKISPSGEVSTFAGNGVAGDKLGLANEAQFNLPTGVCVDEAGNVYVADSGNCNRICKVATNGLVSVYSQISICGAAPGLSQIRTDLLDNLYVGYRETLVRITPSGELETIAPAIDCNCPGLWGQHVSAFVDNFLTVYIAAGPALWKLSESSGLEFFSGNKFGFSDGSRIAAGFQDARDVVLDARDNWIVNDTTRVRRISADGWVSTLAGSGISGYLDGAASTAMFSNISGICVDKEGTIYVSDYGNNCIRKISFVPDSPPELKVALIADQIVLTWPSSAEEYTIESANSLSSTAQWKSLTDHFDPFEGKFSYTNHLSTSTLFYRLHR